MRGTKGTGYKGYRDQGVRILVRRTTIFSGTGYQAYGVREVPIAGSTDLVRMTAIFLSTKYEEHGVREVLIFESTNFVRSTEYF